MKKAKKVRSYDVARLLEAYFKVTQEGMNVRAAAIACGVPRSTLRDRVMGRVNLDVLSPGLQPTFSREEEYKLAQHLKKMASLGYGNTKEETKEAATKYAALLNKKRRVRVGTTMSESWYRGFMRRNKDNVQVRSIFNCFFLLSSLVSYKHVRNGAGGEKRPYICVCQIAF